MKVSCSVGIIRTLTCVPRCVSKRCLRFVFLVFQYSSSSYKSTIAISKCFLLQQNVADMGSEVNEGLRKSRRHGAAESVCSFTSRQWGHSSSYWYRWLPLLLTGNELEKRASMSLGAARHFLITSARLMLCIKTEADIDVCVCVHSSLDQLSLSFSTWDAHFQTILF